MNAALYERDSTDPDLFHPTELTRGPWSPDAQHGGAPAALLATALEKHDCAETPRACGPTDAIGGEGPPTMFVARLTIELLRPVPLAPLSVSTCANRRGRKVQLVSAVMSAGDVEVARATALRIRRTTLAVPAESRPQPTAPPPPSVGTSSSPPWKRPEGQLGYHTHGVEHRFVRGGFDVPGPATDWIRLNAAVVANEPTVPLARVPAAADFGNGVSWTLSRADGWMFINPDLTVYLHRYPTTEWVALEAETWAQDHGTGLAESRLWDEAGVIGRSVQSLLLDRIGD